MGAYSRIAVQALAAVEVANTIQNFFTTVVIGLGAATAVVVGNMIGEGRADQVLLVGRRYLWIAIGAGVGVGALMVATIPLTVVIFPIEAAVLAMVRKLLWVYGLCLPLRAISIMMTMGLLRGGGDTTFAFLVESSTIWLVGVPAVLISALVFKWPIHYVVAFTYLEQVAKGIACLIRFTRGKWIHNLVEQPLQP
ncbi:MAG: MATE family efflux transporter [Clostridiales bacterium]